MQAKSHLERGPFRVDQLRAGDSYELSHGYALFCEPASGSVSIAKRLGASVVGWDPAVTEAGINTGYSPERGVLRAPDIAVGNVPDKPGWVIGAPRLAIEYADVGQDEENLQHKVSDLLDAGTLYLWVVRLADPRCVEAYEPGKPMRTVLPGNDLNAPGVLKNPVQVESLYDPEAAERATLTNLLQRRGYENLKAVLAQGRAEAHTEGFLAAVLAVLDAREIKITEALRERINKTTDLRELDRLIRRAAVVGSASDLFAGPAK